MATGVITGGLSTMTVKIDTNLEDKEYYFVTMDTTDDEVVNLAAAATANMFILNQGVDGSSTEGIGSIVLDGVTKVKTGGAVTAGANLTSDAAGKAVVTTTDTNFVGAVALENGASGDIIRCKAKQTMVAG